MKLAAPEISGRHLEITKGSPFSERYKVTQPVVPLERCLTRPVLNWASFETFQVHNKPMSPLSSFCRLCWDFFFFYFLSFFGGGAVFLLLEIKCLLIPL